MMLKVAHTGASRKYFLLGLPLLLIGSTALTFVVLSNLLGDDLGYVLGFTFYWVVWCIAVPLFCLGKEGFLSMFKGGAKLFRRKNWLVITLVLLPVAGSFFAYFIPGLDEVLVGIVLLAVPIAIVNGACEEILWRGLYLRVFPNKLLMGLIYPSISFALWHISPQLVFPGEGGIFILVASSLFLGLAYGWVAQKTGSIRWNALSHILISLLAFGEPISSSVYRLIGG